MSSSINSVGSASANISLGGPTESIQLKLAKLQLYLSELSKKSADEQMELVEKAIADQDTINQFSTTLNSLMQSAPTEAEIKTKAESAEMLKTIEEQVRIYEQELSASGSNWENRLWRGQHEIIAFLNEHGLNSADVPHSLNYTLLKDAQADVQAFHDSIPVSTITLPTEIEELAKANGIAIPSPLESQEDMESFISALNSHSETLTSAIQQTMVVINDAMGQYNAYLQGASTSISQSNDTTKSITQKI